MKIQTLKSLPISTAVRELIMRSKTNSEIVRILGLPKAKRWYPAWYRAQLVRKCVLPVELAYRVELGLKVHRDEAGGSDRWTAYEEVSR